MIAIGSDPASGQIIISGEAATYAPRSLSVWIDGATVGIDLANGRRLTAAPFASYTRLDGTGFDDQGACIAYLTGVVAAVPVIGALISVYPAARALSAPRAVRLVDGALDYASAADPAQREGIVGLTAAAADAGTAARVQTAGLLEMPGWGLVPDRSLFLGADGLVTQEPPTAPLAFLMRLGTALSPDAAMIRLGAPILLTQG